MRLKFKVLKSKLVSYFKYANVTKILLVMAGLSLMSATVGAVFLRGIYGETYPQLAVAANSAIAFFVFGLSGLLMIRRKEAPGIFPDRPLYGVLAMLYGLFILVVFWGGGLLILLSAVLDSGLD